MIGRSMLTRRELLRTGTLAAAGAALAACGATPAPAATATTAPAAEGEATAAPAEAVATSAPPATEGAVTIRWLDWSDQDEVNNAAIKSFTEKHPNVTVNFEPIGDQWGDKQLTQMVSGNAPDVLTGNDETSYKWAEKGQLLDMNPLVERDITAEQIADFFEYQWTGLVYPDAGIRMGLPYYVWTHQYYYNMDAFDEAGLAYPKAGWKIEDLDMILAKLTTKDASGKVTRWGGLDTAAFSTFRINLWLHIFGGDMVDANDWTQCVISSKESKEAIEWHWHRIWDTNTLIQMTQLGTLANLDPFGTGKVAIQGEGNGVESMLFDNPPKFKWACVAPPVGPAGKPIGIGALDNWSVWRGSKDPEMAWEFAKSLALGDEFQLGFAARWASPPNRKSLLPKFKDAVKTKYAVATDEQIDPQIELFNSGAMQLNRQFKQHKASLELITPALEKILQVGDGKVDILDSVCEQVTALNRA